MKLRVLEPLDDTLLTCSCQRRSLEADTKEGMGIYHIQQGITKSVI